MLFEYDGKIYVKPFPHKIVEVNVIKNGNEYNVESTNSKLEINDKITDKLKTISIEEAYKLKNKKSKILKPIEDI